MNLPFVEKFRPIILDNVLSQDMTIRALKKFIENDNMPHLLFYGPPGTGKTSTINAVINELYGVQNVQYMTMTINASDERGIEIVRNKIREQILSVTHSKLDSKVPSNFEKDLAHEPKAVQETPRKLKEDIEAFDGNDYSYL